MKKLSSRANSLLFIVALLCFCFVAGNVAAQKAVVVKQVTLNKASKTTAHHRHHKKAKRKKGREIIHHSEDDKKLQEIKDAKNKQKGMK